MSTASLPVIDTCDGCGACCMQQSSPPGYLMILAQPDADWTDGPFAEDAERIKSIPPDAIAALSEYGDKLMAGAFNDIGDVPCCWLDLETRQCRWYEHRPSVCRDELERGDAGCVAWREEYHDGNGARGRLRRLLAMFRFRNGA